MASDYTALSRKFSRKSEENKKTIKQGLPVKAMNLLDDDPIYSAQGNPFGICKKCGKEFRQEYLQADNRYQNFDTCHKCRSLLSVEAKQKERQDKETLDVSLIYNPFPWQRRMHNDIATHKVGILACGARTGKDYACIMEAIHQAVTLANELRPITKPEMVPSFVIWIIGPTETILRQNWAQVKKFMPKQMLPKGERSVKDSEMRMELIQGGLLEVRSAYNEEMLVGVGVDFCVITEAARIKNFDRVWVNIEARLMSPGAGIGGKGGKALINSSPRGKNFFYKMFCWGQKNHPSYDSQFFSYQLSTDENPLVKIEMDQLVKGFNGIDITKREQFKRRWGIRWFSQDYEAKFLDTGGKVFPNFRANCVYSVYAENPGKSLEEINEIIKNWQMPHAGEAYRIGYDSASGSGVDDPAIVIRNMGTNKVVRQFNLYGLENDDQLNKVAYYAKYYNNATVAVLTTGNLLVAGQLRKRGVNVIELHEGRGDKKKMVQSLQVANENKDIMVLDDGDAAAETLIFQMEDYQENPVTNAYSNEEQEHDDFVSAMYAAYYDYVDEPDVKRQYSSQFGNVKRREYYA